MNNKKLGSDFEREFCELLSSMGYWVHFIVPDSRGSQPFDIIAARKGNTLVFDCKTSAVPNFSIKRLEENQISAFEKWIKCGNSAPFIAVKFQEHILLVEYTKLKKLGSIRLDGKDIACILK